MEDGNDKRNLTLHRAALFGDWDTAKTIFDTDLSALTAKITTIQETALHVAINAGHSIKFMQKLVDMTPADSLRIGNSLGDTPLHYAAMVGNTEAAKILVRKNPRLPQERNNFHDTALNRAAESAHKETVQYLVSVTTDENPSPFAEREGGRLINFLIIADFYDIALYLLKRYPMLARGRDDEGSSALDALADKPRAFESGSQLGYFQHLLYQYFSGTFPETESTAQGQDVENPSGGSEKYKAKYEQFLFHNIQNTVLMHKQAMELLKLLLSEALKGSLEETETLLQEPTYNACKLGIREFVIEAIKSYPLLVLHTNNDGHSIFHTAVKHRQEKIFNLLYQMGTYKTFSTSRIDKMGNNLLHLAGKLEPSNEISGAALQMQRELQWFKEVEKFLQPSDKELKNYAGISPREVFTSEHKSLTEKGEKWMKDTATSCATVAALAVTVMFAAVFTVPGGNNSDQGIPVYLNKTSFMIFAISNALGLFSSSTSLLMFLGILTSRYSEEDFLKALPIRLSIGLITLFFSIAAMLAAFSAAFHVVLFHKVNWISFPIGQIACMPVTLFALLQFPLLVQMVSSTFGPSIFGKQSKEIIV